MQFETKEQERHYYETEASEQAFLDWYAKYDAQTYARPSLAVDNVVFGWNDTLKRVQILLVKRGQHPFRNKWALPGGFVHLGEDTTDAIIREVAWETGVDVSRKQVEQLVTISSPNRDPRGWIVTVAHMTYLPMLPQAIGQADVLEAKWFDFAKVNAGFEITGLTPSDVAFDHGDIINKALVRVTNRLEYAPTILHVLGATFTLPQAQNIFSQFLNRDFSGPRGSNFKKVYGKLFVQTGLTAPSVGKGRPAALYMLKEG